MQASLIAIDAQTGEILAMSGTDINSRRSPGSLVKPFFYLKAIENGEKLAYLKLGLLYQYDLIDFQKAEEFFIKAVENGIDNANSHLGFLYVQDLNDYKKVEEQFLEVVRLGDTRGQIALALIGFFNKT